MLPSCRMHRAVLFIALLGYMTVTVINAERFLLVSPVAITDIPETVSQSIEIKFLNCSSSSGLQHYNVSITLTEGRFFSKLCSQAQMKSEPTKSNMINYHVYLIYTIVMAVSLMKFGRE